MTVVGAPIVPGLPAISDVKRHRDSLVVDWHEPKNAGNSNITGYTIEHEWFDPASPMIDPVACRRQEVGPAARRAQLHSPENIVTSMLIPARTVRISVSASNTHGAGEQAVKTITWDSHYRSAADVTQSLISMNSRLEEVCEEFKTKRSGVTSIDLMVFGDQHNGKSSFLNHVKRVLDGRLNKADEFAAAPASLSETTHCTKCLEVPFKRYTFRLHDTPAFRTMTPETREKIKHLLSKGVPSGTSRDSMCQTSTFLGNPPHGAILVVSLLQWRDERERTRDWMRALQAEFKHASGGRVEFPYCVVATKRDLFLEECQQPEPHKELDRVLKEIRVDGNTDVVCAVANYKEDSAWSDETNTETYRLLRQLVTLAKNQDTAVVLHENRAIVAALAFFAVVVVAMIACAASAK
eukprot:TRINITY_DN13909_c0_g1_i1.p1 TRINITY_DN13909_c0_g1~~TRINITY_DN13909_c0_g1_i1.p1  ORF type:complete len:438 (-),score=64.56 TRINITY_DN13909_c0_g1_i1:111-1337(-)